MCSFTSERRLDEAIHFVNQTDGIQKHDFTANVKESGCLQVIQTLYCPGLRIISIIIAVVKDQTILQFSKEVVTYKL